MISTQKKDFELIVVALFIVELYNTRVTLEEEICSWYCEMLDGCESQRTIIYNLFISGSGGTGKRKFVHAVLSYCKRLCENARIQHKRIIVVTALTGAAAAVSIFGETTHGWLVHASWITRYQQNILMSGKI